MEKKECGYESLKASVIKDCTREGSCCTFNPEGCDKATCTCFHRYCDKFKWTVDRAKAYGEKTGLDWKDILAQWERDRDCWYMNYYQEYNQPDPEGNEDIRVFETIEAGRASFAGKGFGCPSCNKVSSDPCVCSNCGWAIFGLVPSKGSYLFAKDNMRLYHIFTPVAWEIRKK